MNDKIDFGRSKLELSRRTIHNFTFAHEDSGHPFTTELRCNRGIHA